MIETFLKFGATFDWISPTLAIAQDIAYGPSHTFLIPAGGGMSGREIANMLRQRGIKTWGHMVINGHYTITVRESQKEFATYLLQRKGLVAEVQKTETKRGLLSWLFR